MLFHFNFVFMLIVKNIWKIDVLNHDFITEATKKNSKNPNFIPFTVRQCCIHKTTRVDI